MNKAHQQTHVNPNFQLVIFTVATIILGALFYHPIYDFKSYEKTPALEPLTTLTSSPTPINVGLHIRTFSKSDIIKNDFAFEGTLWFAFDANKVSLDTIKKFNFDQGEVTECSEPLLTTHNNLTVAEFAVRVTFKTNLDYRAYPLDDHILYLTLGNQAISADNAVFIMDNKNFTSSSDAHIPSCVINNHCINAGYITSSMYLDNEKITLKTPRIIFSIACNRIDTRHFSNVFLPLLLIFFLSLFALSFDFNEHTTTIPSIAAAGVPALIAYRFVIEAMSPDVSYFMFSDYLFFLFLFLVFMIFFSVAAFLHSSARAKKYIIISLYIIMIIGSFITFYLL